MYIKNLKNDGNLKKKQIMLDRMIDVFKKALLRSITLIAKYSWVFLDFMKNLSLWIYKGELSFCTMFILL